MYRAFIESSSVGPMTATTPAFFAKFSLIWPACLILFGNKDIRNRLRFYGKDKINNQNENSEVK
jgi:hypothetical protein